MMERGSLADVVRDLIRWKDWFMNILVNMMMMNTGLDYIRRRTNLPSWNSRIVTGSCLSCDSLRGQWCPIADAVAVSEESVLPLGQRSAVGIMSQSIQRATALNTNQ